MCNLRLNLVLIAAIALFESWFLPVHQSKDSKQNTSTTGSAAKALARQDRFLNQ
jgi:hypothetical protein